MATVGEGICQFDNTTKPTAKSPASIKNIIEIRVMSFPYPLSHFGPLILASVFGLSFWPRLFEPMPSSLIPIGTVFTQRIRDWKQP